MHTSRCGKSCWSLIGGVMAVAALLCGPMASANPAAAKLSPAEVQAIAEEGFVYGLPLVMNYAVMNAFAVNRDSGQFKAPFNQIHCEANVFTHENTAVVTPNSDTPYCLLWVDLRAEPMVVSVPAVPKSRYYSVHLCDGNTFNYGFIGTRTTGPEAGDFLIVGPDWKGETPAGIKKVFRSSTQQSIVIFRTQLFSPADLPGVAKVQAGYKAQPLSAFLKQPPPAAAPAIDFPKIDDAMLKANFFDYLDFVLAFGPPGPEEKEIRARLASIGVGPGKTFDFKDLSPELRAAVLQRNAGRRRESRPRGGQLRQEHQRLECRFGPRRPVLLQRQLAAARGRCPRRHLRPRRGRGDVSHDPCGRRRGTARRQQAHGTRSRLRRASCRP